MPSIFSKIITGEAPSFKLWENEDFYAFLDINPINPGHTLVIPKLEIDYILDLPEHLYAALWQHCGQLARHIHAAMKCKRVGMAVEGFSVPHAHVHLIPVNGHAELDPNRAVSASTEELEAVQKLICKKIALG